VYQLTDFYTGIQGITPLSPVLSWSTGSDRIAFVYFELGKYDVYTLTNPRSFKKQPWRPTGQGPAVLVQTRQPRSTAPLFRPDSAANAPRTAEVLASSSFYRTRDGFRPTDSLAIQTGDSASPPPQPESIARLLDSVTIEPPDTSDFVYRDYKAKFEPEYVARPTIGYVRDNFGRGVTGSATLVLGDMLSNKQLIFGASLNGRLAETQLLAQYINLSKRLNWAVGAQQSPYFFYEGQFITDQTPTANEATLSTSIRRLVFRNVGLQGFYPFSRFSRLEGGLQVANVQDDRLEILEPFDRITGVPTRNPNLQTTSLGSFSYLAPSIAYVYDNSLFGYVGPFVGRRARFEISQNLNFIGDGWRFTSLTADYRRYDQLPGPFTLATRGLFFGRIGRDETSFRFFGGNTELIRGWTAGSFQRNECRSLDDGGTVDGCNRFSELIGTRAAMFNAELRFPILTSNLTFIREGLPIVEGAFFYDAGVFWEAGQSVQFSRDGIVDDSIRTPFQSVGFSVRGNLLNFLILRVDYARPLNRPGVGGLWTLSLGPTF
ncbi:MAG: BamA/TamA family outer membrane protein, partial [Gemmatimonadales bacterium]